MVFSTHSTMRASLVLALFALMQEGDKDAPREADKYSLAWSFGVGQSKEFGWKGSVQVEGSGAAKQLSGTDMSSLMKGTLEIVAEEADGSATGNLQMHYQLVQGRFQGNEINIFVKDGKLRKPEGTIPEAVQKHIDAMLAPMKVRVTKRGTLEVMTPHPIGDNFSGIWPPIGPILPAKKRITVGDSWLVPLRTREMKAMDLPPLNVEFSFKQMGEANGRKCAHIVVNSNQMVRLGTTDVSYEVKGDAFFDMAQGECVRDQNTGTLTMSGSWGKIESKYNWEFETLPPRQR